MVRAKPSTCPANIRVVILMTFLFQWWCVPCDRQASTSPVNMKAVTLTTFPFLWRTYRSPGPDNNGVVMAVQPPVANRSWGQGHIHLPPTAPPRGPRPLTRGVSSECSGTRSYETTSRDQRGKIEMFFSSTGACTATKSPIANHRSSIIAQLYFASVTQMFLMPLFVKVESDSSKLLRAVSKSGPNGCKERSRQQRIKIESFLGRQNVVLTVTHSHKQPREEQKMIITWTALIIITKFF